MPVFRLQLKAGSSDGLATLSVPPPPRAFIHVICANCGEKREKPVEIDAQNDEEVGGNARTSANLVLKCGLCGRDGSASFVNVAEEGKNEKVLVLQEAPGSDDEDVDAGGAAGGSETDYATLLEIEARGSLAISGWEPARVPLEGRLVGKGRGKAVEVDLARDGGGEWCDYDDDAGSLGVFDIEARVE
jgi:CXXC motif containing zinc binding protein, eukaryotic